MRTLKRLFTTIFLLCLAEMAIAQDVIVKKDQSTVMSKVLEITSTEIKYKKWNNQEGPTYSISRSEVLSINFENGEVEKFSEVKNDQTNTYQQSSQSPIHGSMNTRGTWGYLAINGCKLTDEQVRNLVDKESYQLYRKAKRQSTIGAVLFVIGGASLFVAGVTAAIDKNNGNKPHYGLIGAGIGIGVVSVPIGLVLGMVSGNKTSKIAHEYNKKNGYNYSFNISPSMMRCENLQADNNYGLGLTMNINF
jgi:hypothetical protein